MAEFIEVRATVEGYERAAALAHALLGAGLAASIDIAEVPSARPGAITWELTLVTTDRQAATLEQHIRQTGECCSVVSAPVAHDVDGYPDWLGEGRR
ncbi:hypothetical protein [Nonomuraea helvata]|uniref:Divalent-cation tolerance protein CutA n=1 Tax=Nonomuraea helvata TaxID=37484 RepID=A0ABV5SCJ6_9ACTN